MKPQSLVRPIRDMKRFFICQSCGHIFMGRKRILPPRCPACGGFTVKEDKRVNY
jgi:rubrerythrin